MTAVTTDRVVIVGAGLGALYAALSLAPHPVLMISPENLGEGASSAWAQGGVAAAMDDRDTPEDHARDTVIAGAGTVDACVAQAVCEEARDHTRSSVVPPDAPANITLTEQLDPAPQNVKLLVYLLGRYLRHSQGKTAENGRELAEFGFGLRRAPVDYLLARRSQAFHVLFLRTETQDRQNHQAQESDDRQATCYTE